MTDRQKECFNLGLDCAARLHEDSAIQYERLGSLLDAGVHKQWAQNIRRQYLRTVRPYSEYIKEAE
jgi:hypothetical protein